MVLIIFWMNVLNCSSPERNEPEGYDLSESESLSFYPQFSPLEIDGFYTDSISTAHSESVYSAYTIPDHELDYETEQCQFFVRGTEFEKRPLFISFYEILRLTAI